MPGDPRVPLGRAFPGWAGFIGSNTESLVFYNDALLSSASISLFGPEAGASAKPGADAGKDDVLDAEFEEIKDEGGKPH